jgi:hypothetical protein
MFDHATWRRNIAERIRNFARNPRQELQLNAAPSVLSYFALRTIEPFLEAFPQEPIAAVLALAEINRGPGADQLVRRATQMRYQTAAQLDRELRSSRDLRKAFEELLIELQTVSLVRQRMNGSSEEWLRSTVEREFDVFPGEFSQLRRVLIDPGWQNRYEALRVLRNRNGRYSPADLVLIHDGLSDTAAHVRAAAARLLGVITARPPLPLLKTLCKVALHDSDAETRFAAARAVGALREYISSPQLLDSLADCLLDGDSFVRSAAALLAGQLGDLAGTPTVIERLITLVDDSDAYTREAAVRSLGLLGVPAVTPDVLAVLSRAAQEGDMTIHEAATDSLLRLRSLRVPMNPLQSKTVAV